MGDAGLSLEDQMVAIEAEKALLPPVPVVDVSDGAAKKNQARFEEAQVWILNGVKHFPYPGSVAHPGLDTWDTGDTMLVASMLIILVLFDIIAPQAEYSLINHIVALGFMVI